MRSYRFSFIVSSSIHSQTSLTRDPDIYTCPATRLIRTSSATPSPTLSPVTSSTVSASTSLKHQELRKKLQACSKWSSWKATNGAKAVSSAVFDSLVNGEEIDLHGTAPRETFLTNLGHWSRYDHADAWERIQRWSTDVASLASTSDSVRVFSVHIGLR